MMMQLLLSWPFDFYVEETTAMMKHFIKIHIKDAMKLMRVVNTNDEDFVDLFEVLIM